MGVNGMACEDVEVLRDAALDARKKIRIRGKLEDGAAPRFPCEFCIPDFIRIRTKVARSLNTAECIRIPNAVTVIQTGLNDYFSASLHGRQCLCSGLRCIPQIDDA